MGWVDAVCFWTAGGVEIADRDADTVCVLPDVTDTEVDQSSYPDFSNRIVCKPAKTTGSVFGVVPLYTPSR